MKKLALVLIALSGFGAFAGATSAHAGSSFYYDCQNASAAVGQPDFVTIGGANGPNGGIGGAFFDSRTKMGMGMIESGTFDAAHSSATEWAFTNLDVQSSGTLHYTNAVLNVDAQGDLVSAVLWMESNPSSKTVFDHCKPSSNQ
jgi:hypothetical protein